MRVSPVSETYKSCQALENPFFSPDSSCAKLINGTDSSEVTHETRILHNNERDSPRRHVGVEQSLVVFLDVRLAAPVVGLGCG